MTKQTKNSHRADSARNGEDKKMAKEIRKSAKRTRTIEGWTIVTEDGTFSLCNGDPLFWRERIEAKLCREWTNKICRARVTLVGKPIPLTKREIEEG